MTPNGPWMQTFTGLPVFPFDMAPEDVIIEDIAHALSMICRFNGHCSRFYSVAEHCLRVSDALPPELKFQGLMHDAAEAYMGDIITPLKNGLMLCGQTFKYWELGIETKIADRCGFDWPFPSGIKHADRTLLATELRDLMAPPRLTWMPLPEPLEEQISGTLSPHEAEKLFLFEYAKLAPKSLETKRDEARV